MQVRARWQWQHLEPTTRVALIAGLMLAIVLAVSVFAPRDPPAPAEAAQQAAEKADDVNAALARYTLLVAIFTGLLVTVSAVQIRYLIRAEINTVRTIRQMQTTEERQLRAYAHVVEIGPQAAPNFQVAGYRIITKNTGQTPAYNAACGVSTGVFPYPIRLPDTLRVSIGANSSRLAIGPGATMINFQPPQTISDVQQARLDAGTHRVYLYGTIEYRDAFGQTRHTNFRFIRTEGHEVRADAEGNDAD